MTERADFDQIVSQMIQKYDLDIPTEKQQGAIWDFAHAFYDLGWTDGEPIHYNAAIEDVKKAEIEAFPDNEPDCKRCEANRLRYLEALKKKEDGR